MCRQIQRFDFLFKIHLSSGSLSGLHAAINGILFKNPIDAQSRLRSVEAVVLPGTYRILNKEANPGTLGNAGLLNLSVKGRLSVRESTQFRMLFQGKANSVRQCQRYRCRYHRCGDSHQPTADDNCRTQTLQGKRKKPTGDRYLVCKPISLCIALHLCILLVSENEFDEMVQTVNRRY